MSRASNIAQALRERLTAVTVDNGYLTDIGRQVYRGKRKLGEQDLPCTVLFEGEDGPHEQEDAEISLAQEYVIEGHAACDPDHPNDTAHLIIADLKRAIFGGDLRLGGLVARIRYGGRMIHLREDGLRQVAAAVQITVDYSEDLQTP